jgi:hypothetical protein
MKAIIIKVNYQLARAVFERDDGEYGWLEILDSTELEEGEIVKGDFSGLGDTTIHKEDGETVDVYIEDFCSLSIALDMSFPKN